MSIDITVKALILPDGGDSCSIPNMDEARDRCIEASCRGVRALITLVSLVVHVAGH